MNIFESSRGNPLSAHDEIGKSIKIRVHRLGSQSINRHGKLQLQFIFKLARYEKWPVLYLGWPKSPGAIEKSELASQSC